jgi:nitrite reductase/ring-hydroxylating ferredoxin subunit
VIQRLSDLREPPVVGRYYLVPFVPFNWLGIVSDWPVLGPMHADEEFFNFPAAHYHIDPRFVNAAMVRRVEQNAGRDIFGWAQGSPLTRRREVNAPDLPKGRPAIKKFRCRTDEFPYRHGGQSKVQEMRAHYGTPPAIQRADGRKLCPHRKVDLSQFPADADGLVTCPLHGLRVCVRASQQVPA